MIYKCCILKRLGRYRIRMYGKWFIFRWSRWMMWSSPDDRVPVEYDSQQGAEAYLKRYFNPPPPDDFEWKNIRSYTI